MRVQISANSTGGNYAMRIIRTAAKSTGPVHTVITYGENQQKIFNTLEQDMSLIHQVTGHRVPVKIFFEDIEGNLGLPVSLGA